MSPPINKTILIVEDENALLIAMTTKLVAEGFGVLQARNGEEGLELALREHPDLILLDILMPVMDGITMYSKLSEDTWGKYAKVIFLTNVADTQKWVNVLGGKNYLVKSSWTLENVVTEVKKHLDIQVRPISDISPKGI